MPIEWLPGALDRLGEVEPYEVSEVLNAKPLHAVPVERRGARLLLIFGRNRAGRIIVVLLRPGADFTTTIVAARPATGAEVAAHEEWERNFR